jgi:hypothetical protein
MKAPLAIFVAVIAASTVASAVPTTQLSIDRVDLMPNRPQPFKLKDFQSIAVGLDKLLFDFEARGQYLPLIWWDETKVNFPARGFGFPSYVGRPEQSSGNTHESITTMGALVGATIAGIDKSRDPRGHDWVAMTHNYFNKTNGENVVLNRVQTTTGQTYWYETFPQILFNCLVDRYPDTPQGSELMRIAAERWYEAYKALAARPGGLNFDHTAFSLSEMKPIDNGRWREPDGAEGIAWILFSAYRKFGDEKYLAAAKALIACTDARELNPHYEINHLYGTYLAARLNAEHDTNYDVARFVNWCFNPSESRPGWGVAVGRWGEYECSGIAAGVDNGYGFVMNTYVLGGNLVPLVRYDDRFARAVGKWMLNATNSVRLCYPDELPANMQSSAGWKSDPRDVVAYEGLRRTGPQGQSPYATGDPTRLGWGPCDLGIYGSGFVGMFAGSVKPTDDPMTVQLDLLACDFFHAKAYPSYLYYNPHDDRREVSIEVGESPVDVYDAVRNDVIARDVRGKTKFALAPDSAAVLVFCPAGAKQTFDGRKTLAGGVVIDFDNGRAPRRAPTPRKATPDLSQTIPADRATITVDADAGEWSSLKSAAMKLDTGGRGKLKADVRLAWDEQFLYVLVKQTARGEKVQEAPDLAAYRAAPWEFDGVWLHIDIANGRFATVGDFVLSLAFNSAGAGDLLSAPVEPGAVHSIASGKFETGNRVIEAQIPWATIVQFAGNDRPELAHKLGPIGSGFRFGCDPMLIEFNHKHQSFIGGEHYRKPTGRDANSRDVVLQER